MALSDAYKSIVGSAAGAPPDPGPPGLRNVGSALGAPPPTGVGALPTGDALSPRAKASGVIQDLAGLKSHFPEMSDRIDGFISELTSAAKMSSDEVAKAAAAPTLPPPTVMPPPILAPPAPMPMAPPMPVAPMGGPPVPPPPPAGGLPPPPIG